jgi:hypothetical protein
MPFTSFELPVIYRTSHRGQSVLGELVLDRSGTPGPRRLAFLELAQVFDNHKTGADAALEALQKAVEALVGPVQVAEYQRQVAEMEKPI